MPHKDRERLYRRCEVETSTGEKLTWFHRCAEEPSCVENKKHEARLSYAWQAEFRALHLWKAPALANYTYMLWMDSDALCTQEWTADPIQMMVETDLVLLFDNISGNNSESPVLQRKIREAYGREFCDILLTRDDSLKTFPCGGVINFGIPVVNSFFHVTNLDFYRSDTATLFLQNLLAGRRFSREWDDQVAVTVPAALEAPHRSWDLRSRGSRLSIFHNGFLDGKRTEIPVTDGSYVTLWNSTVKFTWPEARDACDRLVVHLG
jgi:hypothetical protein